MKEFIKDILSEILSKKEDNTGELISTTIIVIAVVVGLCYAITVLN